MNMNNHSFPLMLIVWKQINRRKYAFKCFKINDYQNALCCIYIQMESLYQYTSPCLMELLA